MRGDQPSEEEIRQVVALIGKLVNPVDLTEDDRSANLDRLIQLVPHPAPTDLIFYPLARHTIREMAIEMLTYSPTPLGYNP